MEDKKYYFITVMQKIDPSDDFLMDHGAIRCWGFYSDFNTAVQALHENWADMYEFLYHYAVIEEYCEGLTSCNSGYGFNRWWFKYSDEKQGYIEIEEPKCSEHLCAFAIG